MTTAPVVVQVVPVADGGATANLVASITTTPGNLIVVVATVDTGRTFSTIADTFGNAYTTAQSLGFGGSETPLYFYKTTAASPGGVTSVTLTKSASDAGAMWVLEISGADNAAAVDSKAIAKAFSASPASGTSSPAPSGGTDLAIGATAWGDFGTLKTESAITFTSGAGTTHSQNWTFSGANGELRLNTLALASATAQAFSETLSGSPGYSGWTCGVILIKASTNQNRTGADTAGGTDAATRISVRARTASDSAGGTDAATRVKTGTRTASDAVGGSDQNIIPGALLASDSFNRADSASTLGSTDGTGTVDPTAWACTLGTFGIDTNQAYAAALTSSRAVATVDLHQADVDISVIMSTLDGSAGQAIVFRYTDDNNFWMWWMSSHAVVRLYKRVAGTFTQVGTDHAGPFSGNFAAPSTFRLVAVGTLIKTYVEGTVYETQNDSFQQTATRHGLYFAGTLGRADSWQANVPGLPTRVLGFGRTGADTAGETDAATASLVSAGASRTGADTVGGSEAGTPSSADSRTGSDTAGESDAATRSEPKSRTGADVAGQADAATRLIAFTRTGADVAGESDAATTNVSRTGADVAGASDAATRIEPKARTGADVAGESDSAARTEPKARAGADTAGESDSAARTEPKARTGADTAGASDVATRVIVFAVRVAFDFAHADSSWLLDENGNPILDENNNPLVEGSPNPIDAATRVINRPRTGADTAGESDVATRSEPKSRTGTDTAGETDVATKGTAKVGVGADTAGASDAATRSEPKSRTAADVAGESESATRQFVIARVGADVAGESETATRTTPQSRSSADTAGESDAATRSEPKARTGADVVGESDIATRSEPKSRTGADTAGQSDASTRSAPKSRTGADATGGTDVDTGSGSTSSPTSDTVGGTDSPTRAAPKSRTSIDLAGAADSVALILRDARISSDTAGESDIAMTPLRAFVLGVDTAGGVSTAIGHVTIITIHFKEPARSIAGNQGVPLRLDRRVPTPEIRPVPPKYRGSQ